MGSGSPVDLLLRGLALQHQLLVGDLQPSSRHVQLLVHLGVLLVHLPQCFQLLGQVLHKMRSALIHIHFQPRTRTERTNTN